jgi:hypothetical protein
MTKFRGLKAIDAYSPYLFTHCHRIANQSTAAFLEKPLTGINLAAICKIGARNANNH